LVIGGAVVVVLAIVLGTYFGVEADKAKKRLAPPRPAPGPGPNSGAGSGASSGGSSGGSSNPIPPTGFDFEPFGGARKVTPTPAAGQTCVFQPSGVVQGFGTTTTVAPTDVVSPLTFTMSPGSSGSMVFEIGLTPVAGPSTGQVLYGLQYNGTGVYAIRNGAVDTSPLTTVVSTATMSMTNNVLTVSNLPGVSTPTQIKVTPAQNALYYIAVIVQSMSAGSALSVTVAQ
jgi:hypothetical protein